MFIGGGGDVSMQVWMCDREKDGRVCVCVNTWILQWKVRLVQVSMGKNI